VAYLLLWGGVIDLVWVNAKNIWLGGQSMLERDKLYFAKYAIDPEIDDELDSYEIPEFDFGAELSSELDNMEIDGMDEDLWENY
jgi:hypothetical protein